MKCCYNCERSPVISLYDSTCFIEVMDLEQALESTALHDSCQDVEREGVS